MFCGFHISLLGKPDSPLPEITEDSEPLVNAIYAWQHTFIDNFPERYDSGETWQVAEVTVKPGLQQIAATAYFIAPSFTDSPAAISQTLEAFWKATEKLYQLQISEVIFQFDPTTSADFSQLTPNFSSYQAAAQWMDCEFIPATTIANLSVTADTRLPGEVARETIAFINSCGISVTDDTSRGSVLPKNTNAKISEDRYQALIPRWDSISVSWLLAALVASYAPKIREKLTISIGLAPLPGDSK
ncbi:MAG: hypothetical protein KH307_00165 [Varibaculum cambriense]|uniref:hypothetical protein n=1 Tax=Varibaculum cambriense TaxID=184870 RepID=UPI00241F14D6|nr:hypothetical protein [Varibaculum cambriense]MBS6618704.1 hypothetical protein [Varibaculum cambriense]